MHPVIQLGTTVILQYSLSLIHFFSIMFGANPRQHITLHIFTLSMVLTSLFDYIGQDKNKTAFIERRGGNVWFLIK